MIAIADSGSTKTSWCLLGPDSQQQFIETEGYNPYFVDSDYIQKSMQGGFAALANPDDVREVYFYGSGCFPEKTPVIKEAVSQVFQRAAIFVELDLLAAARALLGKHAGFAAILGTGTNSCLYNGSTITHNIDSLGYILGDEGSGTALGKKLLGDYIRGYMPASIAGDFTAMFHLTKDQIFQQVYTSPLANRFCGSFAPFILQHTRDSYIHSLVLDCFRLFFTNLVTHYPGYAQYSFNCIGSIGYVFQDLLKQTAAEYGMATGVFAQSPMEGLIAFHGEG